MQYISFLLDETGSMSAVLGQTISGFNEYLRQLENQITEQVRFYLTQFNSIRTKIVYDGIPLERVGRLSTSNYMPDGMTPLYDAIGKTIKDLDSKVGFGDRVLVCIQTDGYENYSKEYKLNDIKSMISSKKDEGWEFVFLGADINAERVADTINIDAMHVVSYSGSNTKDMYGGLTRNTVDYVNTKSSSFDTSGIVTTGNTSGRHQSSATRAKLSNIGKSRNYQRNAKGQFTGVYESK